MAGRRRRRRRVHFKLNRENTQSIAAILLLLASVLTLVSFFMQAAYFNSVVQDTLNTVFGWASFMIPFILALAGLILLRTIYWPFVNLRVLVGLVLSTSFLAGLLHLFIGAGQAKEQAALGQGGGLLGFALSKFLQESFSSIGAFFILVSGLVTGILIISNTPAGQVVEKLNLAGQSIKDAISRWRGRKTPEIKEEEEAVISNPTEKEPIPAPSIKVIPSLSEPTTMSHDTSSLTKGHSSQPDDLRHKTVANKQGKDQVWQYPPLSLLSSSEDKGADRGDVSSNARIIEDTLDSFGIKAKVAEINLGPSVTQYALSYTQGTKISKVRNLQNDLAMALASPTGSVRIEAPIPGKSLVGVEVPNTKPSVVGFQGILSSKEMKGMTSKLGVCVGRSISGKALVANLARMPHVLVAGATGSGKSTLIHGFLASLLFRCSPNELKLILVDTKRVELTEYSGIPHLLTPVVVEPEKVISALKWAISEMERRYRLFQDSKVRDIDAYNKLSGFQALPYIIILVDELADMMMLSPVETEKAICRLAQLARATGIHLILATQRPSVNVITGLIKANIPCRIAFNVVSQIDSRVIIDQGGAEKLLGRGDMLYVPPDASKPRRVQGVYVTREEIRRLAGFLKKSDVDPDYKEEVTTFAASESPSVKSGESEDELYQDAIDIVVAANKGSASLLQRKLKIGYARAARLLDDLERNNIVSPAQGSKPREVLLGAMEESSFEEDYYHEDSRVDS